MVKNAFASNYLKEMNAPELVSSMKGKHAEEVVRFCKKIGVPVKKSSHLSQKLEKIPLATEIPPELYKDVADIFLSIQPKKI